MYRELNEASRRQAGRGRTSRRLPRSGRDGDPPGRSSAGSPATPRSVTATTVVPVPIDRSDRRLRHGRSGPRTPLRRRRHRLGPEPRLPRPAQGEHLESRDRTGTAGADPRRATATRSPKARPKPANTRSAAPRSTSPAKSATAEEDELAALARQRLPAGTPVGISGLEQAFNARLAGKPGGTLLAVADDGGSARTIAKAEPQARRAGEDDDRPRPAGSGGLRPRRPRRRRRGPRRPQRRRPRPRRPGLLRSPAAGLDLQDDHDDRRAAEGRRLARRRIRNHQRRQRRRPLHRQRQRRVLRRHLPRSLRRVVQRRLRPARAEDRQRRAGRNGGTVRLQLAADPLRAEDRRAKSNRAESTIPTEIGEEVDLGVTRDRPGRSAGDAAGDGERRADDRQRRRPRADLDRRQQEAAAAGRSRCG